MVTKWHQLEFMAGHAKESGIAKKCCYQFFNFTYLVLTLKCSMVTKLHQPESMAENGNESLTAKKMPCLRSDYAIINFGSISPIFDQILKCLMVTKWHQPESISGYANESRTAKNRNYTRLPSSPSCQLDHP